MKRLNLNSILVVGNGSVATNEYGFYRYFVDNRVYYHRQALVIVADETPTVCCGILMNISLLFEHRHAGGATVAATALSLYSASGCLIGFFFGKIFYKLKRLTLVFGYFIAAAGAGILGFAKQTEILMIGSAIMGMTSVLLITSAYAILGMYISPNQSSLAIAIATGVSNLGGFASAYYLNMLGIITGEKLFTPIYVLMGVYTLLATAFMVYDPLRKNS